MPIKVGGNNELIPPSDFDENLRLSVMKKVEKQQPNHPEAHTEFIQAWGSLMYRFYACTEHDEAFVDSIRLHSDTPNQPYRYQQERELFNFFMNGLSTIECLCYGLFAIGAMVDKTRFPFTTDGERRAVNPKKTSDCYNAAYSDEPLSASLAGMLSSPAYKDWYEMRRFLFHRIHPGRTFNRGGTSLATTWIMGKTIDQDTTAVPRKWLASTLMKLLAEADTFVSSHL